MSHLYIFAGFPGKDLPPGTKHINAGGLRAACTIEDIGELEERKDIQVRKEGVFIFTPGGEERLSEVEYQLSPLCYRDGITWRWFNENWSFGNGVTLHKTTAMYEKKIVVFGTEWTVKDLLDAGEIVDLSRLRLHQVHDRTEGWEKYKGRWMPGKCPQESLTIHLTWLVFTHKLPEFAYERLRQLIEVAGAQPHHAELYKPEHFSVSRVWDGKAPKLTPELARQLDSLRGR